nr:XRE family transcriptional regulator [uncultured Blautia sp.]
MKAYQVIKKYIDENGIRYSFVADNVGMNRELFSRSMDGKRVLKADEFIKICILLSLDLEKFNESEKASA